jgi:hypothetical protein
VYSLVHSCVLTCAQLLTLSRSDPAFLLDFLKNCEWHGGCTRDVQPAKGASRLIDNVLAPSNAARGFSRLPFGTPLQKSAISVTTKGPLNTCVRCYTFWASDAVSSGSLDIHRWLSEFREAQ